jgi:hypothetical protein
MFDGWNRKCLIERDSSTQNRIVVKYEIIFLTRSDYVHFKQNINYNQIQRFHYEKTQINPI